jgi:hypothetical protein
VLKAEGLTKAYDEMKAVDSVDIEVRGCEIFIMKTMYEGA